MASSTELLPSDVMFEILTRTPSLETLDTCNKVSKGLKHLIHEPTFMHTYCQRTKNVSGFFTQCMKFGENVSRFVSLDYHNDKGHASMVKLPRSDMDILASCRQGILCCQRREDIREYIYSVCKPTTGQIQDLPSPGPIWETVSMSIIVLSSSPLRYKIIRLWTPSVDEDVCNNSYHCKIFDSETWEWRDAGVIKFPIHETIIARSSQPVTTADNTIYWLTCQDNVVEFCDANESFRTFRLPKNLRSNNLCNYRHHKLVEYKGGLGLVLMRNGDMGSELWLYKEDIGKKMGWRKEMEVEEIDPRHVVGFFKGFYDVMIYSFQQSWILGMLNIDWQVGTHQFFPFRSDLEPVDLGRG